MVIEVAVLADSANVAESGKLNILGVFNRIIVAQFPAIHLQMSLVLRYRVDFGEAPQEHEIAVMLKDDDGHVIKAVVGRTTPVTVKAGRVAILNQILNFGGVIFQKAGSFTFEILWNGKRMTDVPLYVEEAQQGRPDEASASG